jgi:hypothetical protein
MTSGSNTDAPQSRIGLIALILSLMVPLWVITLPASLALGITAIGQNKISRNDTYRKGKLAVIISAIGIILLATFMRRQPTQTLPLSQTCQQPSYLRPPVSLPHRFCYAAAVLPNPVRCGQMPAFLESIL